MVKVVQIYPPGYEVSRLLCVVHSPLLPSCCLQSSYHIIGPFNDICNAGIFWKSSLPLPLPLQQHNPLQQQQPLQQQNPACLLPHLHIVNCLNINITEPSAVLQSVWNIKSAPIVRATYLLEKYLEERIIATYLLLLQQPIYYFSFCSNLLAS